MSETTENQRFTYKFGKFVLDPQEKTLFASGKPIHLPAKEFETLLLLVENNGKALTKEEMMTAVWQDAFVEENNLAKYISRLRKILNTKNHKYIETLPKHGYRFSAEVNQIELPPTILEKRTIKKLTVKVEEDFEETPRVLLPSFIRHPSKKFLVWLFLGLVAAVLGFLVWRNRGNSPIPMSEKPIVGAPFRLTDNQTSSVGPRWMKDGRIRFYRVDEKRQTESWIMNDDGTNQQPVKDFENLKYGIWSPDGQKVIFPKPDEKNVFLLANADGSNPATIPYDGSNIDWSSDSKQIVYEKTIQSNNAEIFVYSLETGENRNLTNSPDFDADPAFSPDGKEIAFVSGRDGNYEIYVMKSDGSNVQRLTNNPAMDNHPTFSPDGTQIAFTSERDKENSDVFIINADGSGDAVNLTNWDKSDEIVGPGGWSPDGTKIAFVSDRDGRDNIYVMSAEVFHPQLVLSDTERNLGFPSYSPDGKKAVYEVETADKTGELRILDLETHREKLVIKTEIPAILPAWSPDGEWIAFQQRIEGNTEICVVKPDGSDLKNLTNNPARDVAPAWSPDGRQIAFASNRGEDSGIFHLYLMNADGSNQRQVFYSNGISSSPAWSPDGASLIFTNDKEEGRSGNFEIFRLKPETGEAEKRLTFRRSADIEPVFSPDGSLIAFVSKTDGNPEIYLMKADGTRLLRLTRNAAIDVSPHFSPNGKKLIFSSNRDGKFALYEIQLKN